MRNSLDFLGPLRTVVSTLESLEDGIPDWINTMLDAFSIFGHSIDWVVEQIMDEIPSPSIPLGSIKRQFDDMFNALDFIVDIDTSIIDEIQVVYNNLKVYNKSYNLPYPMLDHGDYDTFNVNGLRYKINDYTGAN